ncbi:OsmC family protein [Brevibacterium sp. CT2-23B]|uniref:OsmC family protein n=1 Tax=Brevibacterium sp. CT2-23B TaxID=2729630 RepID=UPI0015550F09|nr:OsmC family protein [Brevibacterium sp. CT2-23B]
MSIDTTKNIDVDRLKDLSEKNKATPEQGRKTIKVRSVTESGFRNLNYARDHEPFLISEPHPLLGDDKAPNPTEIALGALGSCINVGIQAIATYRGVTLTKLEIALEGEIDISAVWGVGDLDPEKQLGITKVRANISLDGDADDETLQKISDDAVRWSPVANTFIRPVELETSTTTGANA